MHLGMVECRVSFTGHYDLKLDLRSRFKNNNIWSIFPLLFEVLISNLECECILQWWIVLLHFPSIMTLTSDLVSIFGITSKFFEVGISNLVFGCVLGWPSVAYHFWVTVTLTSDQVFRIIMFGAFFLYYLS